MSFDLTQCDRSYNIHWNCNCTGRAGATPIWIKIGMTTLQGCQWQEDGDWHICYPGAQTGSNGGSMNIIIPGPPCVKLDGKILISGSDAVFCQKGEGTETPCPADPGGQ